MSLSPIEIRVLNISFRDVEFKLEEFEDIFYTKLFENAPHLRSLFAEDLSTQRGHMGEAFNLFAKNAENIDEMGGMLREMGGRHTEYGADENLYPIICVSMVEALAEVVGSSWTQEAHEAWSHFLEILSQFMIEGTRLKLK